LRSPITGINPIQAVDAVAEYWVPGTIESDIQELRQRIEPRHSLLAGEIGERGWRGIAEIEPEAASLRTKPPPRGFRAPPGR